jgi:DNA-binding IclR family transcriptional regulator
MTTWERKPSHVQSVDRAISVLEYLSRNGLSGVTEIANLLNIHKSTAYRIVATLEARGLVEQDPESEKYQLGFGLVSLASSVTAEMDIVRRARPICDRLSDDLEETTTITMLEGDDPVVVYQSISSSSVLGVDWTGSETPIHCTAAGKIYLAHMPERRVRRIIARDLEALTEYTITDRAVLQRQLEDIVRDGFAFTIDELEIGLVAVGAPIYAIDGHVVAVISVSGPSVRLTRDRLPEIADQVKAAAAEVSQLLGYRPELVATPAGSGA